MRKIVACLIAIYAIAALPAYAADQALPMWRIEGERNSVYLLGSVHLLRESDYPIPAAIYEAYDDAEALIMELDMDDMDPLAMQALVMELGMLADGQTLQDALGTVDYQRALALANELEIPLAMMGAVKPWLAAMTIEVLIMSRLGFDPGRGVEMHLMNRAVQDNKPILGLETERQQLEMLDGLSELAQRDMLLQTLAEGSKLPEMLDELINAWRNGDLDYLQKALLADMRDFRELYKAILVDRNKDWVGQIKPLLKQDLDYLIVVGTLHLVGSEGVPALLRQQGINVQQMHRNH